MARDEDVDNEKQLPFLINVWCRRIDGFAKSLRRPVPGKLDNDLKAVHHSRSWWCKSCSTIEVDLLHAPTRSKRRKNLPSRSCLVLEVKVMRCSLTTQCLRCSIRVCNIQRADLFACALFFFLHSCLCHDLGDQFPDAARICTSS